MDTSIADIKSLQEKFVMNTITDEERIRLYQWLQENPDKKSLLFRDKDIWQLTGLHSDALNKKEQEEWHKLSKKISAARFRQPFIKSYTFRKSLQIAALVVIALVTGWTGNSVYRYLRIRQTDQFDQLVTSGKGQIMEVFLTDGTHVWLNSESTLEFPNSFSSEKRVVRLDGEAYFQVQSDRDHPFYVHSGQQKIQVTGTRFNVKKYPEDHLIETVLEEGKVKILGGNIARDLLPGQRSSFHTQSLDVKIDNVDFEVYTSWRDGRYEFKNERFDKIMKIVERWWDVEVVYDQAKLKDFTFSGVLKKHKDVDYIFDIINQFKPIDYHVDDNKIIVKVNQLIRKP